MSTSEAPLLVLEDISLRREGRLVLERVNLSVQPGELHLLVGPNGAGKSTLLQVVLGALAFEGRARLHPRRDGRIGFVPQRFESERSLTLTVADFLALRRQRRPVCLGLSRTTKERIASLLSRVGLEGFERRNLHQLSGGELQRVLLAHALDPAPELLLLDEPSSGLDEPSAKKLEETVLALRKEQATSVLWISHDLGQVRRLADRVTLLSRTVLASGSPTEMLERGLDVLFGNGNPSAKTSTPNPTPMVSG